MNMQEKKISKKKKKLSFFPIHHSKKKKDQILWMKKGGRYSTSPFLTFRGLFISCSLPLSFLFSLECSLTVFHENVSCAQQQKLSDSNLQTNPPAASTPLVKEPFNVYLDAWYGVRKEKKHLQFTYLLFFFCSFLHHCFAGGLWRVFMAKRWTGKIKNIAFSLCVRVCMVLFFIDVITG